MNEAEKENKRRYLLGKKSGYSTFGRIPRQMHEGPDSEDSSAPYQNKNSLTYAAQPT